MSLRRWLRLPFGKHSKAAADIAAELEEPVAEMRVLESMLWETLASALRGVAAACTRAAVRSGGCKPYDGEAELPPEAAFVADDSPRTPLPDPAQLVGMTSGQVAAILLAHGHGHVAKTQTCPHCAGVQPLAQALPAEVFHAIHCFCMYCKRPFRAQQALCA